MGLAFAQTKMAANKKSRAKPDFNSHLIPALCQTINVELKARLDVGCFVLVDNVVLGKLVQHLLHLRQKFYSGCLVSSSAEFANSVTHSLSVVSVVQSASRRLTNSFYR